MTEIKQQTMISFFSRAFTVSLKILKWYRYPLIQCFVSGSAFNALLDPDPEGGKSAHKKEKLSLKTGKFKKKNCRYFLCSHIFGKELGLNMFNVRKI
jgi:hypothetical protein